MFRESSKSKVQAITSQFYKKYKGKINFINKQGIICELFEEKQQQIINNHNQPIKSYESVQIKQTPVRTEIRYEKSLTPDFSSKRNLSLPRLKSISVYDPVKNSSRTQNSSSTKKLNQFMLGIPSRANVHLGNLIK